MELSQVIKRRERRVVVSARIHEEISKWIKKSNIDLSTVIERACIELGYEKNK